MAKKVKPEPAAPVQEALKIVDGPMATGYNSARSRKLEDIKWIVIHYTGCNGSAHALARSFARPFARSQSMMLAYCTILCAIYASVIRAA